MRIAILTANLGSFDQVKPIVEQTMPEGVDEIAYHCFTDKDFPPIAGLTPRLQYRIPKLFGWEMFPDYDIYIWLDGSVSLQRPDCVEWYLKQLSGADAAFFRHPQRGTVKQEVEHIEEKLKLKHWYITPRYENGLHRYFYDKFYVKSHCEDTDLYASTAFIYRNNEKTKNMLQAWWYLQSRYYTCDQVHLPLVIKTTNVEVNKIRDNLFKIGYLSLVSHHK